MALTCIAIEKSLKLMNTNYELRLRISLLDTKMTTLSCYATAKRNKIFVKKEIPTPSSFIHLLCDCDSAIELPENKTSSLASIAYMLNYAPIRIHTNLWFSYIFRFVNKIFIGYIVIVHKHKHSHSLYVLHVATRYAVKACRFCPVNISMIIIIPIIVQCSLCATGSIRCLSLFIEPLSLALKINVFFFNKIEKCDASDVLHTFRL